MNKVYLSLAGVFLLGGGLIGCGSVSTPQPDIGSLTYTESFGQNLVIVEREPTLTSGIELEHVIVSPDRKYRAYTVLEPFRMDVDPPRFRENIFVEDLTTNSSYELQGLIPPNRSYFGLVWLDDTHFEFKISWNPHTWTTIVFDAEQMELTSALPGSDFMFTATP